MRKYEDRTEKSFAGAHSKHEPKLTWAAVQMIMCDVGSPFVSPRHYRNFRRFFLLLYILELHQIFVCGYLMYVRQSECFLCVHVQCWVCRWWRTPEGKGVITAVRASCWRGLYRLCSSLITLLSYSPIHPVNLSTGALPLLVWARCKMYLEATVSAEIWVINLARLG